MKRKINPEGRPLREVWDRWTDAERQEYIQNQLAALERGEHTEPPPGERERMERALARARRRRGRPKIGKGAARINITLEKGFLKEADAFRKRLGWSRSELIAEGIRRVMNRLEEEKRRKAG